jgi:hypothetical protein
LIKWKKDWKMGHNMSPDLVQRSLECSAIDLCQLRTPAAARQDGETTRLQIWLRNISTMVIWYRCMSLFVDSGRIVLTSAKNKQFGFAQRTRTRTFSSPSNSPLSPLSPRSSKPR